MAINRLPSAYDYIGEGISGFNKGRDKAREQKLQEFNIINQLYQSGGATAEQLSQAARNTGIPSLANFTALPSAQERKDQAVAKSSAPYRNVPQVSGMPLPKVPDLTSVKPDADLEAEVAGVSTPTQRRAARTSAEQGEAQLKTTQLNQIKTQNELNAQPQDIKNRQNKEADDLFRDAGKRFVSKYIDPATITAANRQVIVDKAFNDYKTVRQSSSMGQVPDETYARSFFDDAFTEALKEKAARDLQLKMRLAPGQMTQDEKIYMQLEATRTHVKDQMDDLANRDKMLVQFKLSDPKYTKDPNVIAYNRFADQIKRLEEAQSKILDPSLATILKEPPPGATTTQDQQVPAPANAPQTGFSKKVTRAVELIIGAKPKDFATADTWIKEYEGKTLTKDEANEVRKRVREKIDTKKFVDTSKMDRR